MTAVLAPVATSSVQKATGFCLQCTRRRKSRFWSGDKGSYNPAGQLDGHQQVYAQDLEDGEPLLLLDLGERIDYLHLSRDGSLLLFARENLEGDLYVIE